MEFRQFTAKTVDDAITEALIQLGISSDQLEYEILEKGSTGFLGINSKKAVIQARKKGTIEDKVRSFLEEMFEAMHLQVTIDMVYDEDSKNMDVDLKGPEMGVLIGKRGKTLDAIQDLARIVANKDSEEYVRVKIDTENYRKRRRETIEGLARNIAYKVKRTKKPVSLENMNAYERRIIHSTLQNDRYVTTYSEGEEPYRHVVIALKK
ncbi:MAG: protein jag [Lachnospiraceae bacterium]|nr:protein jag [Lachnospiraceae bacterium]